MNNFLIYLFITNQTVIKKVRAIFIPWALVIAGIALTSWKIGTHQYVLAGLFAAVFLGLFLFYSFREWAIYRKIHKVKNDLYDSFQGRLGLVEPKGTAKEKQDYMNSGMDTIFQNKVLEYVECHGKANIITYRSFKDFKYQLEKIFHSKTHGYVVNFNAVQRGNVEALRLETSNPEYQKQADVIKFVNLLIESGIFETIERVPNVKVVNWTDSGMIVDEIVLELEKPFPEEKIEDYEAELNKLFPQPNTGWHISAISKTTTFRTLEPTADELLLPEFKKEIEAMVKEINGTLVRGFMGELKVYDVDIENAKPVGFRIRFANPYGLYAPENYEDFVTKFVAAFREKYEMEQTVVNFLEKDSYLEFDGIRALTNALLGPESLVPESVTSLVKIDFEKRLEIDFRSSRRR